MKTPPKIKRKKKKSKIKLAITDVSGLTTDKLIEQLSKTRDDLIARNHILLEKQVRDEESMKKTKRFGYLYPFQDDPEFNSKIISKKEFNDIMHSKERKSVREHAEEVCNNRIFELMPHQLMIRNYLSFNTPYNNLLLFHGLGSGKTCSAITITEMMRTYFNQIGITKRIIIVASPNVQVNFRTQLFDERKLTEINGIWNLNACTGNKYLKEINPMNMKGLKKKDVIRLIRRIINKSYLFLGPEQFANYIAKTIEKFADKEKQLRYLKREFSNRMVVIDEVHNIRSTTTVASKKISKQLMFLVENVDNIKLLLLTATPMFNSNEEIVWLLNLMNANDGRPTITMGDVFDSQGNLKIGEDGREIGKERIIQKARSYVSYMRGENPYSFPLKVMPSMFLKDNTYHQPLYQMNGADIVQPVQYLDLYYSTLQPYQQKVYDKLTQKIVAIHGEKGLGYQILSMPLQALTMTYPSSKFDALDDEDTDTDSATGGDDDDDDDFDFNFQTMVGKQGLKRVMKYNGETKRKFEYRPKILEKYGRIFSPELLSKYSSKIAMIAKSVVSCDGVVLIYSQYIDGGCVPIALALEEMGLMRYGDKRHSLYHERPPISSEFKYAMITGDILMSPNNAKEIAAATSIENTNGDIIKAIIISEAGSEGIDLKFVRQVHIVDPWYNLGRIEQIIGRAIRNCSHKSLPFEKRNVEVYMHATQLLTKDTEATDVYLYRTAEYKAIKIGEITRILKSTAMDCLVNKDVITDAEKTTITISSGQTIPYVIGDLSYSYTCDYMRTCDYECDAQVGAVSLETYNDTYVAFNNDIIINRIKELFREKYVYTKAGIIGRINYVKQYPVLQINSALSRLVNDNSEFVVDVYNNPGRVVNVGLYYLFQPAAIEGDDISMYERTHQPDLRNKRVRIVLKEDVVKHEMRITKLLRTIQKNFNNSRIEHTIIAKEKDLDWYKAAGNFFTSRNVVAIDDDTYNLFIARHIFDTLDYPSRLLLFNHVLKNKPANDLEMLMSGVLTEYIILEKYVVLAKTETNSLVYFTIVDNELVPSKATEIETIIKELIKIKKFNLNSIIGFIGNFKKKYSVFKIKNTTKARDTGYRADQKGKVDIIKVINTLLGREHYTYANTKVVSNSKEMCVDQELLFRYFNEINKDKRDWFLSQEDYIISNYILKK